MAGARQPTSLVVAKGKKHFSKAEIEERMSKEIQPCTDDITAPDFLTAKQKKEFDKIAGQLKKLKVMGETDTDLLARYVTAQSLYEEAVKDLREVQKQRPKGDKVAVKTMVVWAEMLSRLDKRQDRYFKQAQAAASSLGLTISSRCKLIVPVKEEQVKVNKFAQFAMTEERQEGDGAHGLLQ